MYSQVAKLYGFAEKLQFQQIDRMEGEEVKPLRKELAKRCNSILDLLEQKNQTKSFSPLGEESVLRVLQLPTYFCCGIVFVSGPLLKFTLPFRDYEGGYSQLVASILSKLIDDGFLDLASAQIQLTPPSLTLTELLSINQTLALSEKFSQCSCSFRHLHELATPCLLRSDTETFQLVLSVHLDLLSFSICHVSPSSVALAYFTSLDLATTAKPLEALQSELSLSGLELTALPVSAVWCVGADRERLHQSIAPSLLSLTSFKLLSSTHISSEYFLPHTGEDRLFSAPPSPPHQSLSLFSLGIASPQSRGSVGYIPLLDPHSPLPLSITRRLVSPPLSPSDGPGSVCVALTLVEKYSASKLSSLLQMAITCPLSALSPGLAFDVTLTMSLERVAVISLLPLIQREGEFVALESGGCLLSHTLLSSGATQDCHSIETPAGPYELGVLSPTLAGEGPRPGRVQPVVWVCEVLSLEFKQAGNDCMVGGDLSGAVQRYTAAIDCDLRNGVLFSNRCAALTKLGQYTSALCDAEECVRLLPHWEKGWSRRGGILSRLGRLEESVLSYEKGELTLPPPFITDTIAASLAPENGSVLAALQDSRDALTLKQAKVAAMAARKVTEEEKANTTTSSRSSSNACALS
jgi:hypothetical protein